MPQDERETAIHEAAHAVIAHYYGAHVTVVRLSTDVADGEFRADLQGEAATRVGKLLITLAGAAAQDKLVPGALSRGRYHLDWKHDMEAADRYVESVFIEQHGRRPDPFEARKIEQRAVRKLDQLLSDPAVWAAVHVVAQELMACKALDGDRFRVIVAPHLAVGGGKAMLDDDAA